MADWAYWRLIPIRIQTAKDMKTLSIYLSLLIEFQKYIYIFFLYTILDMPRIEAERPFLFQKIMARLTTRI